MDNQILGLTKESETQWTEEDQKLALKLYTRWRRIVAKKLKIIVDADMDEVDWVECPSIGRHKRSVGESE